MSHLVVIGQGGSALFNSVGTAETDRNALGSKAVNNSRDFPDDMFATR